MRAVVQRVSSASVTVAGAIVGEIGPGLLVLLGIGTGDTAEDLTWLATKIANLRIFEDADGKMNLSVREIRSDATARVLVVSQFTLLASTRKGTRPSFNDAAKPDEAIPLYEAFVREMETLTGPPVATGRFGAMMQVALVNDGPVTIVLDSRRRE
ncbi:MAG TPA: D-aminoacyl-tRNA deacylase [Opitutus sp.]|nr:D-aminoacyl-tRNA deacylase [Opitutus sp.]